MTTECTPATTVSDPMTTECTPATTVSDPMTTECTPATTVAYKKRSVVCPDCKVTFENKYERYNHKRRGKCKFVIEVPTPQEVREANDLRKKLFAIELRNLAYCV